MLHNLNISNALNRKPERLSSANVKGQNHQHRATPCDRKTEAFQALKGRKPIQRLLSPLQGLELAHAPVSSGVTRC